MKLNIEITVKILETHWVTINLSAIVFNHIGIIWSFKSFIRSVGTVYETNLINKLEIEFHNLWGNKTCSSQVNKKCIQASCLIIPPLLNDTSGYE